MLLIKIVSPQFSSSSPFRQSLSPSHVQFEDMHLSEHVNSSSLHNRDSVDPTIVKCSEVLYSELGIALDEGSVTPSVTASVTPSVTPSVAPSVTPSVAPSVTPSVGLSVGLSVTSLVGPSVKSVNSSEIIFH